MARKKGAEVLNKMEKKTLDSILIIITRTVLIVDPTISMMMIGPMTIQPENWS